MNALVDNKLLDELIYAHWDSKFLVGFKVFETIGAGFANVAAIQRCDFS
jgi:hypothetical protein